MGLGGCRGVGVGEYILDTGGVTGFECHPRARLHAPPSSAPTHSTPELETLFLPDPYTRRLNFLVQVKTSDREWVSEQRLTLTPSRT